MVNPVELTGNLYYEDTHYMSVSSYKKFQRCEYAGTQPFGKPTTAMKVGSYVDSAIEGTLAEFRQSNPDIFLTTGKNKGSLKSEFQNAEDIITYIENDAVFKQFMSGEKQVVMTGEIAGVPWKIKMDSYFPSLLIADLKVMAKVANGNGEFIDFITPWGYDIQMACYQEIVRQNTGNVLPCYICAVSKTEPINSVIVQIPQNHLDAVLYTVKQDAPKFYEMKQGKLQATKCGKCKHCISTREETPIVTLESLI